MRSSIPSYALGPKALVVTSIGGAVSLHR
jgi:hypothetical protein